MEKKSIQKNVYINFKGRVKRGPVQTEKRVNPGR